MLNSVDIKKELIKYRQKARREEDNLLREVGRILHNSAFNGKNVLDNLKHYNQSFELVDEEDVDPELIFKASEIREIAIKYRLRFLDSQCYKQEFPYEAILKIEDFNLTHKKSLKGFKVLGTTKFFAGKNNSDCALLFAPTNLGNYYLVHKWGKELKWSRAMLSWPVKNIETLFLTLIIVTLVITLSLPTYLITLDRKATYWCAYRIGIFFHLFIFNMGVTAYVTFAFSKNLSTSTWNNDKEFP
jgi:hypothetical protein